MWGILQAALSTPSRALQANPSLSMPIGMVSPRAAGEPRATFLGREAQPRLLCAVVRVAPLPRVPVSPCPSPGQGLSAGPAQLPRLPGSISPAAFLPPGACRAHKPAAVAQCPSRGRKMGEEVLMVAWVRCVLAACTPRGSDGISALIHTPSSYPSHHRDVVLSPCGCPC